MVTNKWVNEVQRLASSVCDLVHAYDDAAKRVIESWEHGDLAGAVRQLQRVYERRHGNGNE